MTLFPSLSSRLRAEMLLSLATLLTLGAVAIYSASGIVGMRNFNSESYFLKRQLFAIGLSILLFALIQKISFSLWRRLTPLLVSLSLALLGLCLFSPLSSPIKGARRWLRLGPFHLQPAEIVKMTLILAVSYALTTPAKSAFFLRHLDKIFLALALPLLLAQPDFGSSFLLLSLFFMLYFVSGLPRRYVLSLGLVITAAASLAVVIEPYRMARLVGFLNPWLHIKNEGFQLIQSYISFRNGGLWGVGLGQSQQKLFFLPEAHTDFIFSVLAEELGLFGVLLILLLYANFMSIGYRILLLQADPFKRLVAFGVTSWIGLQVLINMGVTMGLLPTKGMTLPFMSYGGSSILCFMAGAGWLYKLTFIDLSEREKG